MLHLDTSLKPLNKHPENGFHLFTGIREKVEKASAKESRMKHKLSHLESPQSEHDFLGCMSK